VLTSEKEVVQAVCKLEYRLQTTSNMGNGVAIYREDDFNHHPDEIKAFMNSKEELDRLFNEIARETNPNLELNPSSWGKVSIGIRNLVKYFESDHQNKVLKNMVPYGTKLCKEVLLIGHKHVVRRVHHLTVIGIEEMTGKKRTGIFLLTSDQLSMDN
jgi:chemotaxis methyl-accepting protein methylase